MKNDIVPIGSVPRSIFAEVLAAITPYHVALLGIEDVEGEDTIHYVGSGTMLSASSKSFILTAAHVWEDVRRYKEIGLCLSDQLHDTRVPTASIMPLVSYDPTNAAWGPDLAFLAVPTLLALAGQFGRRLLGFDEAKSQACEVLPDRQRGFAAIVGAPASVSAIDSHFAGLRAGPWIGGIDEVHPEQEHGGFDYVDVGVDKYHTPGVPTHFGGVSGGSLWQFVLHRSTEGEVYWRGAAHLLGVAIRQLDIPFGRCVVRCHGPKSLYHQGARILGVT